MTEKTKEIRLFRFCLELIKYKPLPFIWNIFGSILFFFTQLAVGLIVREIFNTLLDQSPYEIGIWTLILLIPLAYFIRIVVDVLNTISEFTFVQSTQALLRTNIMEGVFEQPGAAALASSPGESISRFRGDTMELTWFVNFIAIVTSFSLFSIVSFIILYSISPQLTSFLLIPFVIVMIIVIKSRNKVRDLRRANRKAAGKVTGSVAEIFGSIQAIKVTTAEEDIVRYFEGINEERRITSIRDSVFSALLRRMGMVVVAISTGVILFLAGQQMRSGDFTIGDFTLFTSLLGWIFASVRDIGEFIAWHQRSKVSYDRMYHVMKGDHTEKEPKDLVNHRPLYINKEYPFIPAISEIEKPLEKLKIDNLSYIYPNSQNGIYDVSFEIEKGGFTVITGKIGSGKTTLLRALLGLLPIQSGEIIWNGKVVDVPSDFFVPPRSSYTSQVPTLFSETVKENLLLGLPEESDQIENAVELAVVNEDIDSLSDQYNTKIGPKGVKLSGGQKQRLAAARMFIHSADLIVVDDLSSALDVETEKKLWEGIFKSQKSTFLIVSHRKSVLKQATKVVVIKDGRVDAQGELRELLSTNEEMKRLWKGDVGQETVVTAPISETAD